jgi:uncharacterized protein (DUF885 family)
LTATRLSLLAILCIALALPALSCLSGCNPASPQGRAIDVLTQRISGLDFGSFLEASFRELSLRDPESLIAVGLERQIGAGTLGLTDVSDAYAAETLSLYAKVLEALRGYDRESLSPADQISYDAYEWFLDDELRRQEFALHNYLATFMTATSIPEQTLGFFTRLHPMADRQDARNYVARLRQVGVKFEQLLEGLGAREAQGIVPPRLVIEMALKGIEGLPVAHEGNPYYRIFASRLEGVSGLGTIERWFLLRSARSALVTVVAPAYQELESYLRHQLSVAPEGLGVSQLPRGDDYYAYLLRHHTTVEVTADEVHALGYAELERIHAEIREICDSLGYPAGESLTQLFDRVAQDGGLVPANEVYGTYEALIAKAQASLGSVFARLPRAAVVVSWSPVSGSYEAPAVDGSRPGVFHAGPAVKPQERFAMPTLAYHEAIPGHHVQISLAQEVHLPFFRYFVSHLGFVEGWALYAERLAWELGWYDDDPYGNLGRLQAEAQRAARLVVDTGIHCKGWTFDKAVAFFVANTGFGPGDSVDAGYQVARYAAWPGQATAYAIGMLRILELRQKARDELGDRFSLKDFHSVLLDNGSLPLEILEQLVDDFIATARDR